MARGLFLKAGFTIKMFVNFGTTAIRASRYRIFSRHFTKRPTVNFRIVSSLALVAATLVGWQSNCHGQPSADDEPAQRKFNFVYAGAVTGIPSGARVQMWFPLASSTEFQDVEKVKWNLPVNGEIRQDRQYKNQILYAEIPAANVTEFDFKIEYDITRTEANGLNNRDTCTLDDEAREKFLVANRLVPITGRPLELIQDLQFPAERIMLARKLYDRVDEYMQYDKSKPGYGNGDVMWACESRTGNCTDFHSVFIALARSKNLPAYFEIGFPLPPERGAGTIGGYHCWANFFVDGRGWIPVDISEADKHPEMKEYYFGNLTENRLSLSIGRDIQLEPPQSGQPLNYFVYPYVEVDGTPWPSEQVSLSFQFTDR